MELYVLREPGLGPRGYLRIRSGEATFTALEKASVYPREGLIALGQTLEELFRRHPGLQVKRITVVEEDHPLSREDLQTLGIGSLREV
ncbi:hypothetical protein SAMN05920897_10150 [Alkalispirochaeta americana]|uniref:Uncharacterized protein n=1 Tax=Alkalispirochaeta americana TaxID=159291 RepID=A0A1N6N5M6_9SPIO|nr:hypothetical protein [Alkalispirochaeta americana]SIP87321.1 hypothetical protein SAMN05920897_10150 [Alkalispirochaeta americana]